MKLYFYWNNKYRKSFSYNMVRGSLVNSINDLKYFSFNKEENYI